MISQLISGLSSGIRHLLYPPICLLCDRVESTELSHGLCEKCLSAIVPNGILACPRCAATTGPHTDLIGGCGQCKDHSFPFTNAFRLGPYEGQLRDAVLRMKFSGGEMLAEMFGRIVAEKHAATMKSLQPTLVVPIPLHWWRRWQRGYNQAEAIAREIARGLAIDFRGNWLSRTRATSQHAQPSASARKEHIRGAFRVRSRTSLAGRKVLLVDDVMTTGSTVAEAARTLREAGAERVIVAVLARA